jgi:ribosome recycling factor
LTRTHVAQIRFIMKDYEEAARIRFIMKEREELKAKIKKLEEENRKLTDEVESLWAMMDEMTKSDIENWKHLVKDLEKDVITRALMITKKKADA